jgi:hypothetical protein
MNTIADAEHLAEFLKLSTKPIYVFLACGEDSWQLLVKPFLLQMGEDFAVIRGDPDGKLWVFSDCEHLGREDLATKVQALPTAAPGMIRKLAAAYGDNAFELSEGWAAAVRGMAEMEAPPPFPMIRRNCFFN